MVAGKEALAWVLIWNLLGLSGIAECFSDVDCTCKDESLCNPVSTVYEKEVLGFVVNQDNWISYNWTHITTLAMFTNFSQDLICFAHSKKVRVVLSGNYPISEMGDQEKATKWIQTEVARVIALHADGYNVDIEDPTRSGTDDTHRLTAFMAELSGALKKANPKYQLSMDVAWSPKCIDERCYDVLVLSKMVDFLVVMSYDERSQIHGPCIASANSALDTTASGLSDYVSLGIDPGNLVMGVPWYGYNYPCLSLSADNVCAIKEVPFRGVNCSDAAGSEVAYSDIMKMANSSSIAILYDQQLQSPYFNICINGTSHQIWFDNPKSLSTKFMMANDKNLRGIAFWNFDSLDFSESSPEVKSQTAAMWQALDSFFT